MFIFSLDRIEWNLSPTKIKQSPCQTYDPSRIVQSQSSKTLGISQSTIIKLLFFESNNFSTNVIIVRICIEIYILSCDLVFLFNYWYFSSCLMLPLLIYVLKMKDRKRHVWSGACGPPRPRPTGEGLSNNSHSDNRWPLQTNSKVKQQLSLIQ